MTSSSRLHEPILLATAVEAVIQAGDLQMARAREGFHIGKKGTIDLVTEVDLAVEEAFRRLVASRFPDHAVLGEEQGIGDAAAQARCRWLFDPIDGTTNFAHGLPIFCSSAALEIDGRVEVAAIYDPNRRELFTAERGGGAFVNGRPLRVSRTDALVDAVLVTGFPYNLQVRTGEMIGTFTRFLTRARAVRRLGSAAIDLCYVAAGRLDGFWEEDLKPWDVAAGMLILQEAGGRITTFSGGAFSVYGTELVASNDILHDQMLAVIGATTA